MKYVEINKYSEEEVRKYLNGNNINQIITAIISHCKLGDNYNFALEIIDSFYTHKNKDIRRICVQMLVLIPMNYGKMNLILAVKILKAALKDKNKEIQEEAKMIFGDLLHMYSEHAEWLNKNVINMSSMLKSDQDKLVDKSTLSTIDEKLCCNDMDEAIKSNIIEYDSILRIYSIDYSLNRTKLLKFCPWCSKKLPTSLTNKYFAILEKEYKIDTPDLTNFTNVPSEFKTDEWWKKRGL